MHKVEKVDGGWSCAVEYRVETINAHDELIDLASWSADLDDALASARAIADDIERDIENGAHEACLLYRPVAVIVERADYVVETRAEARRLAAINCNEPFDHDIVQTIVATFEASNNDEARRLWVADCSCARCAPPTPPTTPTTDDAAQTSTSTAAREAVERDAHAASLGRDRLDDALAEVETPRALWLAEADDLDRLPSLGSWLARDWYERARCIVVAPSRDRSGLDSWLVVRGQERRLALGGPFVIADMPTVDPADERPDNGRAQRLGSSLHLACVAAAEARDAQGRAAAVVVVSADGQVRDLGRDADAAVQAYAQALASWHHDRAASGVSWEPDAEPARRFWAALGVTA